MPIAPIPAHELLVFLLQIGLLLLLAKLLGRVAAHFALPAIIGELLSGVVLGPSLFGKLSHGASNWLLPKQAEQMHLLDGIGQVAVILLVGLTGMELDFGLIRRRLGTATRVSLAGIIVPFVPGVALGYPLAHLLGIGSAHAGVFAFFLGVAMSVSAIPVIAKTLLDMNLIHRNVGQLTLIAGMIDDAFGWFLLSIVSALAVGGVTMGKVSTALLSILFVIVAAALIGRPVVGRVLRLTASSAEATTAAVAVMILLAGALTQSLKLEAVFGAFVCGILIGSSADFAWSRVSALRTVVLAFLAPLFFATAGLRIDLGALAKPKILVAAVLVLLTAIAGKFIGAYIGGRLSRLTHWEALALGAGMNARGVIEVIVAMVGLRLGVLDTDSYTIIVLVAVVTSLMAPPILHLTMRKVEHTAEEDLRLEERVA